MEPGDLVRCQKIGGFSNENHPTYTGIILTKETFPAYETLEVLCRDGEIRIFGNHEIMEVINELTDRQLDAVRGGMSLETFGQWRSELLNEEG